MEKIERAKTITLYSTDAEEFLVTKKRVYKEDYRPFGMIGPYKRKNSRKKFMDLFDLLLSVPRKTAQLWNEIKENSDPELGIAVMAMFDEYDKPKMGTVYRRLAKLKEIDLIRKLDPFEIPNDDLVMLKSNPAIPERHSYMINPNLLKPWKYDLAKKIWDAVNEDNKP